MDWAHRRSCRAVWLVALASACVTPGFAAEGRDLGIAPPPYGEFVVIPLRVHILSATDLPEIDCGLTDADIDRIVAKVNGIWHQAGIHWGLDAVIREPAARQNEFTKARDAGTGLPLDLFRSLAPESSKTKEGLHVYYIHRFSVNGVYLGDATAFVQETAKLRPVAGGIEEPLPRVTAHELGHALGLPHRQDLTNLLASGTTGTTLNAAEVERAREFARKTPGTRTVGELRQTAEATEMDGDLTRARLAWSHLAAIPGAGAAESARRRDQIIIQPKRSD